MNYFSFYKWTSFRQQCSNRKTPLFHIQTHKHTHTSTWLRFWHHYVLATVHQTELTSAGAHKEAGRVTQSYNVMHTNYNVLTYLLT